MSVLSTFLESLINFLSSTIKKTLQNQVKSRIKVVSNYKLQETQFKRTVRDKIACKTHLELENVSFKHIFGNLNKFPI